MGIKHVLFSVFIIGVLWGAGDAGQEIAVLDIGYGSRAMALGSAYVAHPPDASSLYWNPAALGFIEKNEMATSHTMLASDAAYYYLGGVYPQSLANWGFSWAQLQLKDIPETAATLNNNEVEVLRQLTYLENAVILGAGRKIFDNFAVGFNLKHITKKISDNYGEGKGYAAATGFYYIINNNLTLGCKADNVSNTQIYDTGKVEHLPPLYTAGCFYKLNPWLNLSLAGEKEATAKVLLAAMLVGNFVLVKIWLLRLAMPTIILPPGPVLV